MRAAFFVKTHMFFHRYIYFCDIVPVSWMIRPHWFADCAFVSESLEHKECGEHPSIEIFTLMTLYCSCKCIAARVCYGDVILISSFDSAHYTLTANGSELTSWAIVANTHGIKGYLHVIPFVWNHHCPPPPHPSQLLSQHIYQCNPSCQKSVKSSVHLCWGKRDGWKTKLSVDCRLTPPWKNVEHIFYYSLEKTCKVDVRALFRVYVPCFATESTFVCMTCHFQRWT